jgi:gamma-glutamyltranspeptidase/glutathione hydrolase
VDVLKSGGNAVDAAVATAFALAVVLPSAGNIGGGGFIVTRMGGTNYALDFREKAPGAASRDVFLDDKGCLTTARSRVPCRRASREPSRDCGSRTRGSVRNGGRLQFRPITDQVHPRLRHSARSATVGARRAARRAGR